MKQVEQVGGSHYSADYQHWDWAIDTGIGPIEYAATKYIARWEKKANPLEDVKKAISYIQKVRQSYWDGRYHNRSKIIVGTLTDFEFAKVSTQKFTEAAKLRFEESTFMSQCLGWKTLGDIDRALATLDRILVLAQNRATGGQGASPGPTPAATPASPALGPTTGPAQGATGQGARASATTASATSQSTGMAHPFGFDEDDGA